jgi:hypothetical protein
MRRDGAFKNTVVETLGLQLTTGIMGPGVRRDDG